MLTIRKVRAHHVIDFAAEELKKYLRMMMPRRGDVAIAYDPAATDGFRLGLLCDFSLPANDVEDAVLDDVVYIDTNGQGGVIAGSNPRSVLLAVYRYLRLCGCRWLFPGVDGEYIPMRDIAPVRYRKKADNRFRGQCNEGAESQQCMLDIIDFTPKIGMNVCMMEFDIPRHYYDSYYNHKNNTANREPEPVNDDVVLQWKRQCEAELAKRGLQFHDIGHGWTMEALNIGSSEAWDKHPETELPPQVTRYLALVEGKRALYHGVAINTNLCMSNPEARRLMIEKVVAYAARSGHVDFLHVWLADWQNNHCECENCSRKTPSDWYVILLNEIDEALTAAGLSTRVTFCAYSDTAWAPETETIKNPARFSLLLGAISRDYRESVPESCPDVPCKPYVRNKSGRFETMAEYLTQARRWRQKAACPAFAYEYHFWKHQYFDPGVLTFARHLYEDIHGYHANGYAGIIEDGSQRSFFPNGFAFYLYGEALFDLSVPYEELENDYFTHAYGAAAGTVLTYLRAICRLMPFDYLEIPHSLPVTAARFRRPDLTAGFAAVEAVTRDFERDAAACKNAPHRAQTVALRLLYDHAAYCRALAAVLTAKAEGDDARAAELFKRDLKDGFGKREIAMERYYDHMLAMRTVESVVKTVDKTEM